MRCDVPGAYAARNVGIKNARGDWLVFTDADCLPSNVWLEEIANVIKEYRGENIVIAGKIESYLSSEKPSIFEIYDLVRGIPQEHFVNKGYAATANIAIPNKLAVMLNGFNQKLFSGGDVDFCKRAGTYGFQITYFPSVVVKHRTRTSWKDLATKARRIKGGQLALKTVSYKLLVILRTLLSPFITANRFLKNSDYPFSYRLIAIAIYIQIWLVELVELVNVLLGKKLERR